ncbi:hypothetical protein CTheo_8709 [Ceratobasidium theobromae]|uniref:Tc1-like transposase DDE domain-containing protein n=1 Tax=Ceratobasidium theobromae TaxID=1582974 RepID=A0A5N5Q836_9AGAM|nr:hypothetical protein CTheo_8709 [Ceratobasidium theobromae]
MPPHTSAVEKAEIVAMVEHAGMDFDEVARKIGRHLTTVGRPRKLTESDANFAVMEINRGGPVEATQLQRNFFPGVSVDTVRRRLKDQGLENFKQHAVPFLKKEHIKQCREWGEDLLFWTLDNWSAVIYSDASKFDVFGSDGHRRVWQKRGQALKPKNTIKKVAHGGGRVMVWGCITRWGVGRLRRIETTLTAAGYAKILSEDLLGTLRDYDINPHGIYFQCDKDKKQWTKLVATLLENHGIDSLPWPASSPDMNIIENLWDHLDHQVHSRNPPPKNRNQLWQFLQEEWEKIDQNYIAWLYESIPTRVQTLVENKGGNTGY